MCRNKFGNYNNFVCNNRGRNSGTIYVYGRLNYYVDDECRCNNYPVPYTMMSYNYLMYGNGYGVKNAPWHNNSRSCDNYI